MGIMTKEFKEMLEEEAILKEKLEILHDVISNEEYITRLGSKDIYVKNLREMNTNEHGKKVGLNEHVANDVKKGLISLSHVFIITELELNKNEYVSISELIQKDFDSTLTMVRILEKLGHVEVKLMS